MLHICSNKKGILPIVRLTNKQGNHIICQCGQLLPVKPIGKGLGRFLASVIVLQIVAITFLLGQIHTNPTSIPQKAYADDEGTLLGADKTTYYLNKTAFLKHSRVYDLSIQNIGEFRDQLMSFLLLHSELVKDLYKRDTTALWLYLQDKNTPQLEAIVAQTEVLKKGKSVMLTSLKDWKEIIIYHKGDKIPFQKKEIATEQDPALNNIPTSYFSKVNGQNQKLRLTALRRDSIYTNIIHFQYTILNGGKAHKEQSGSLSLNDKSMEFTSLGKASYASSSQQTTIELLDYNIVYTSN